MSTWMTDQEAILYDIIAKEIETLMLGYSPHDTKKRNAIKDVNRLIFHGIITLKESVSLLKMIDSKAGEDLDFAITLMDHLSTQNSTQDGSNIYSTESQVPELRS